MNRVVTDHVSDLCFAPTEGARGNLLREGIPEAHIQITGNTVILEHLCGVYTLYYHLNSLSVKEGELVEAGTQIGEIGATGFVTGPHLHWELRVAGVAVDPEAFISTPILDKGNAFLHIVP